MEDENEIGINTVHNATSEQTMDTLIPEHLVDLVDRSKTHLDVGEHVQLTKLILEYQDVFSKDDYVLGNFTAIEHCIDTGDARPIKQKNAQNPQLFC